MNRVLRTQGFPWQTLGQKAACSFFPSVDLSPRAESVAQKIRQSTNLLNEACNGKVFNEKGTCPPFSLAFFGPEYAAWLEKIYGRL